MAADRDTIDLAEVVATLRRGWRWIAAGAVGGLLLGGASLLLPTRYEATASVLLRDTPEPASGFGGGSDSEGLLSFDGLASVLTGVTGFDTEMEILTSRSVMGAVVDSLGLQATVLEPDQTAPMEVFADARWDPHLREAEYRFERAGDVYRVSGPGASAPATPGEPYRLGGSVVILRSEGIPDEFEIRVVSRQEAVDRFEDGLDAEQAGGDVAELTFDARDPLTAATAPNALIARYLVRRRTTDRGINQRRYEFLADHTDSIRIELAQAAEELRRLQEQTGVLDPEVYNEAELEQGLQLQTSLNEVEVEARAFEEVLAQAASGTLEPRKLAAYPTFLSNPAINNLLSSLQTLELKRTELLDRRTERDPDVVVLDQQIDRLENQLVTLSRSYLDGLNQQRAELESELTQYSAALARLPAQAEAHYQAKREVERLSETLVALQTQLIQARLAAIGEGGDVRQIDVAVPPEEPEFPKPLLNLGIGLIAGLVLGFAGALGAGYFGHRVRDHRDATLAAGVPAIPFDPRAPLLLGGTEHWSGVLVIPVGEGARSRWVANRIAATAALQGTGVALADLERGTPALPQGGQTYTGVSVAQSTGEVTDRSLERLGGGDSEGYVTYRARNGDPDPGEVRVALEELERRFELVVVALNGIENPSTTALLSPRRSAILTAQAGRATRAELGDAVDLLRRVGIHTAGVVLHNGEPGGGSGA